MAGAWNDTIWMIMTHDKIFNEFDWRTECVCRQAIEVELRQTMETIIRMSWMIIVCVTCYVMCLYVCSRCRCKCHIPKQTCVLWPIHKYSRNNYYNLQSPSIVYGDGRHMTIYATGHTDTYVFWYDLFRMGFVDWPCVLQFAHLSHFREIFDCFDCFVVNRFCQIFFAFFRRQTDERKSYNASCLLLLFISFA